MVKKISKRDSKKVEKKKLIGSPQVQAFQRKVLEEARGSKSKEKVQDKYPPLGPPVPQAIIKEALEVLSQPSTSEPIKKVPREKIPSGAFRKCPYGKRLWCRPYCQNFDKHLVDSGFCSLEHERKVGTKEARRAKDLATQIEKLIQSNVELSATMTKLVALYTKRFGG